MRKDKPGTGVLFKSTSAHPNAPSLSGSIITPEGDSLKISCWPAKVYDEDEGRFTDENKVDRNGNPYYKVKIEEDDRQSSRPAQTTTQPVSETDIPF